MMIVLMIRYDIHDDGDDDNHDDNKTHDDDNHDDVIPASTDDTDLDLASDRETADDAWSGEYCERGCTDDD